VKFEGACRVDFNKAGIGGHGCARRVESGLGVLLVGLVDVAALQFGGLGAARLLKLFGIGRIDRMGGER
jgi:hypothetical protein